MPGVEFYDHDDDSRYGFRDLIASPGGPCVSIAQVGNHVESIRCNQASRMLVKILYHFLVVKLLLLL